MISNIPLFLTYILSVLVMIGLPIVLAVFFTRRFKISWWVVLTGVLTYVVSQALHIPALSGVNTLFTNGIITVTSDSWFAIIYSILIGLLAGVFEEIARWVGFKLLRHKADRFGSSLAAGIGHGGIESIFLCVVGLGATLVTVLFYNPGSQIAAGTSTGEVQYMLAQIEAFWTVPWSYGLLSGVERVITLTTHLFLSALVWKAVIDRNVLWLLLAILYHMIVDAVAVFLQQIGWSYWPIEGVLAIFMLLNLYMLYTFYKEESQIEKEMDEMTDEELAALEEAEDEEEIDDEDEEEIDDEDEEEAKLESDDALEIDHPEGNRVNGESPLD